GDQQRGQPGNDLFHARQVRGPDRGGPSVHRPVVLDVQQPRILAAPPQCGDHRIGISPIPAASRAARGLPAMPTAPGGAQGTSSASAATSTSLPSLAVTCPSLTI